ncbi:MAG TPA: translation initiation factor IF-2 [bacterium]|nr:translation initiation factor IF-2 [bacterium]
MRVHELAKELGLSSKTVMEMLAAMKVSVKSHSSSLDDATVERVRRQAKSKAQPAPAAPPAPVRVAKTPTGERILGMRKIVPPPPPAVEEPLVETAEPAAGPERAPRIEGEPVAPPPVHEQKPAPAAEPRKPAAAVKPATRPAAPPARTPTKDTRPSPPRGAPGPARPQIRPAPPRREMPRHAPVPGAGPQAGPPTPLLPLAPPPGPYAPPRERKTRERMPPPPPTEPVSPMIVPAEIDLSGPITVGELAARLEIPAGEVVKKLLEGGVLAGINQQIPLDVATKAVQALGSSVRAAAGAHAPAAQAPKRLEIAKDAAAPLRPPVVTIMGHVDHGKTSLLDAIRQTNVADREVGGITQHIGASTVETDGRRIVFIDTPGHEAFTTLRARGAQVTDIAILVVAADDGVMPQTIEAMNHAKAAGVPIIVAVNKIDLSQANPDRVKQQLAEQGLTPEDWGGDTVTVPVSARTKQGVKELLEMILLVAELHELRADPTRPGRGTVVEATLDKGRGPVATVLVQEGTLRVGDAIVAGEAYGRVRAMSNDRGDRVTEAPPATPVEVVGLSTVPVAGDMLEVVRDDRLAKAVAEERVERRKAAESATARAAGEDLYAHAEGPKELRIILKADTHGSVEALSAAIVRLGTPEVGVTVLHEAVGNVTESDVMLAAASRALVVGFNVRPDAQVRKLAEQEQIDILAYRIIYEAIDDLKARTRGLLAPKRREVSLGQAEVRQTFSISRVGMIAGCYVTNGAINRGATMRVIRDGVVVHEGKISSLRRFKEDVREVTEGFECGIALERFNDVKEGDILEAFEVREEPA